MSIGLIGMLKQIALEGQDLPRTYLAHHEPACVILITIIIVMVSPLQHFTWLGFQSAKVSVFIMWKHSV